jgi:prepilin-type N-terminal cleavage/methylation domain-containing protein
MPSPAGMTLIELMIVLAVASILAGIGLPLIQSAVKAYDLTAAVQDVAGSIQSTRYQAIATGCPYSIAFDPATASYQVSSEPLTGTPPACAAGFSNLGSAIPWSTSGDITVSAATTLQFSPNGTVAATAGAMTFALTNGSGTETITVSGVGNVTVSP